ncbi:hypothetical protein MQE36_14385 [Zhouia spongiae]|uniref:DUF4136 domain-containing protein n=1 Tax=Zhouia spongiae TaxID=2202721 RepID=A0ABY3YK97_9FLAO|nr:hypothetical protein [Zhouia spongiae]UNY98266.1 hypothetical protein MQE36_14385 [Zhouia spongiae]
MKTRILKASLLFSIFACTIFLFSCEQQKQTRVEKPEGTITVEEAKALQQNYVKTRGAILRDTLKYTDVRDVTFTIKELKQYIAYVEQELGSNLNEESALRIYFGAYPPSEKYRYGLSTVFIAPTQNRGGQAQQGSFFSFGFQTELVEPLNKGTGGEPPTDYP